MELFEAFRTRQSIRKYSAGPIPTDQLDLILQAGLSSASGRGLRPFELVVVTERCLLDSLAECRVGSAQMLKGAAAAIVVIASDKNSDTWIEDCSIVMANMHLAATGLGIGSCWIQGRLREATDGSSTQEFVSGLLGIPSDYHLEAILSLGIPAEPVQARDLPDSCSPKVHWNRF